MYVRQQYHIHYTYTWTILLNLFKILKTYSLQIFYLQIDIKEYIGDMFNADSGEEEPDWIETEKKQFADYRFVYVILYFFLPV